jgi:hypothetical protein
MRDLTRAVNQVAAHSVFTLFSPLPPVFPFQREFACGRVLFTACLFAGLIAVQTTISSAADQVSVVVGEDAPRLERFAADELARQLTEVFDDVAPVVATSPAADAKQVVLVGSPATNPHIKASLGSAFPKLSDQGLAIVAASDNTPTLVVGGGIQSPRCGRCTNSDTGWASAICCAGTCCRMRNARSMTGTTSFSNLMRVRNWRTINDFAIGPESWGLAEHEKFLGQLAKMKFNHLMLQVWPWQPFVTYEFGGVQKQSAMLWFGDEYPIDGESAGKKAFSGKTKFENPDFAGLTTPEDMTSAGIAHVTGIIEAAHRLGMTVGISISPLEFPREFQPVLPGSRIAHGLNELTIVPGAEQGPTDDTLRQLVATQIRAYLDTYPQLDALYLTMPEFPEWDQHAESAWELLKPRLAGRAITLDGLIASARERNLVASGERGIQAIKGNVVGLAFFNRLFEGDAFKNDPLLNTADNRRVELVITDIDSALFPVLDAVLPQGAGALNFVDYTARRVAENRELLRAVPADRVRSQLIVTLADDNVGVPQSACRALAR